MSGLGDGGRLVVAGVAVPAPIDATIRGAGPSPTQHTAQGGLFVIRRFIHKIVRVKGKMLDILKFLYCT